MTADLSGFNSLADLAARISDKAAADALKSSVEHTMAAGDLRIEAKAKVPQGQWLPSPQLVVGSSAARAPPQKKTSLEGAGCRQFFQRPRISEIIHMNKRTLQGAGQKSPANTSAPFDPTNLRLPSEPPRRADGRLKGRSRDKLKSWEQDAAIAEVKEAQWQRFWNWIATAAIESPLVPKQPPGSHVRGSRWEQVRGMLIEELGGAANLTQLQIGLVGNLALLRVAIEELEGQSIRGEQVDLKVLASLSSQLLRTSVALGLGRTQAPHNPLAAILFPKKP